MSNGTKEIHMKELKDPLGRDDSLAWMRRVMNFSFNTSSTNMIFGKKKHCPLVPQYGSPCEDFAKFSC